MAMQGIPQGLQDVGFSCVIKEYVLSGVTAIRDVAERALAGYCHSSHNTSLWQFLSKNQVSYMSFHGGNPSKKGTVPNAKAHAESSQNT
jgi:hypothetical protein